VWSICRCFIVCFNLFAALLRFEEGPPFTLQRLCEVILLPFCLFLEISSRDPMLLMLLLSRNLCVSIHILCLKKGLH
jgi:hypothetical protein